MSDIASRVKKIIVEHLCVDEAKAIDTAILVEDLGADSLDEVELVVTMEAEFDIEITDADAERVITVKDAIDAVTLKVGAL